jgi:transposase-like protein
VAIPRIKTRVPFSKEQKLAILKEGERVSVKPICAKYKISDGRYRYWRKTISGIQPRKQLSSQQKLRILEEGC